MDVREGLACLPEAVVAVLADADLPLLDERIDYFRELCEDVTALAVANEEALDGQPALEDLVKVLLTRSVGVVRRRGQSGVPERRCCRRGLLG